MSGNPAHLLREEKLLQKMSKQGKFDPILSIKVCS